MKKLMILSAVAAMAMGAQAVAIVEIRTGVPTAPEITNATIKNYDCFLFSDTALSKAMGETPDKSLDGVNAIAQYLSANFADNYATQLEKGYTMVRDSETGHLDFRNQNDQMLSRFGVVVYNPVDGTKEGVDNISYFRVFQFGGKSTINDANNTGYWSTGWTSTSAVPEPTSGLLLLLGVAGLALRRKQRC